MTLVEFAGALLAMRYAGAMVEARWHVRAPGEPRAPAMLFRRGESMGQTFPRSIVLSARNYKGFPRHLEAVHGPMRVSTFAWDLRRAGPRGRVVWDPGSVRFTDPRVAAHPWT